MVQKNKKPRPAGAEGPEPAKRRGRPRAYQPEVALGKALDLFRKDGFAATSLDDLAAGTGMNRPSLYGAFGDKQALYLLAMQCYREQRREAIPEALAIGPERAALRELFNLAASFYPARAHGHRIGVLFRTD